MKFIQKTMTIAASVHEAFEAWTDFESRAKLMKTVAAATILQDGRLHWLAVVGDDTCEWDVDLVEHESGQRISWRAVDGRESGNVRFEADKAGATKVTYRLDYDPQVWRGDAKALAVWMNRRVDEDLERFKEMVEGPAEGGAHVSGKKKPQVPAGPPDGLHMGVAYAILTAGVIVGMLCWWSFHPSAFKPAPGISIFAAIYVFAQCIERLMEPLSSISIPGIKGRKALNTVRVPDPKPEAQAAAAPGTAPPTIRIDKAAALHNLAKDPSPTNRAILQQARRNRAALLWAVASFLAMLAAGSLGLLLLHAIGLTKAPIWLDILVTGLAIGSGTKPLHDLISNLQQSSGDQEQTAATKGK